MNNTNLPKINNRKIKVALVGCGRISNNHFKSIEKHKDNLELVSICEIKSETLNEFKKI